MRKLFAFMAVVLLTASVFAQSPEKMSYQAVIRDDGGDLVTEREIGMQISILQDSESGTVVYVETQQSTTNSNGVVSIEIGTGTTTDNFATIDWADGPYFIKIETAVAPPLTSYTITGTSQLLSVPYALHAKTADNAITAEQADAIVANTAKVGITPEQANAIVANTEKVGITPDQAAAIVANTEKVGITTEQATKLAGIEAEAQKNVKSDWDATEGDAQILNKPDLAIYATKAELDLKADKPLYYLGQEHLGGIIYYLYYDEDGNQRGLVVSTTESTGSYGGTTNVGANRTEDGAYNTNLMPADSDAKIWVTSLGEGWYLPSSDELSLLWHNRFHVNKTARAIGSTLLSTTANYWSSTEFTATNAWRFAFNQGFFTQTTKTETLNIRAVRAF